MLSQLFKGSFSQGTLQTAIKLIYVSEKMLQYVSVTCQRREIKTTAMWEWLQVMKNLWMLCFMIFFFFFNRYSRVKWVSQCVCMMRTSSSVSRQAGHYVFPHHNHLIFNAKTEPLVATQSIWKVSLLCGNNSSHVMPSFAHSFVFPLSFSFSFGVVNFSCFSTMWVCVCNIRGHPEGSNIQNWGQK